MGRLPDAHWALRTRVSPAAGFTAHFDDGEEVRTEVSAKFRLKGVVEELQVAGFAVAGQWLDVAGDYCVTLAQRIDNRVTDRTAISRTNGRSRVHAASLGRGARQPTVQGSREVREATEALARPLSAEDQLCRPCPTVPATLVRSEASCRGPGSQKWRATATQSTTPSSGCSVMSSPRRRPPWSNWAYTTNSSIKSCYSWT